MGGCLKLDEFLVEFIVKYEDRCYVVAAVAVIRSRPDRHKLLIEHLFVALHDQLVGPHDLSDVVGVVEGLYHVCTEEVTRSSRGQHPACDV